MSIYINKNNEWQEISKEQLGNMARACEITQETEIIFQGKPVKAKDIPILVFPIPKTAPVNDGNTPLHIAARNGNLEIVTILLKNGADPNLKNNVGQMPLHLAAEGGHNAVVSLLSRYVQHSQPGQSQPGTYPATPQSHDTLTTAKRSARINFWTITYLVSYVLIMFLGILANIAYILIMTDETLAATRTPEEMALTLEGLGVLAIVIIAPFGIMNMVAMYYYMKRLWEEVPKEFARTTSEFAGGLMLIPIFWYYWCFQVFPGLVKDMNKSLRHPGVACFSTDFMTCTCYYWVASAIISLLCFFMSGVFIDIFGILQSVIDVLVTAPAILILRSQVLSFMKLQ